MKFSVLIPVYNTEKYLEECLQSVFCQTHNDYEIILVDDGSTDSSADICDRYQSEHPDVIKVLHQENQGQLISRCNAIKVAQGDYCIFMDADDLIVETALETLNNTISEYNSPDMVVYSFFYEGEDGSKRVADKLFDTTTYFNSKNKEQLCKAFFEGTLLNNVWTKCVKTQVLKQIEFDFSQFKKLRCSEDRLHAMATVDACETAVYVYEPLYRYRLFEGSVTRRYTVDSISKFNTAVLYDVEKDFLEKWGLELPLWKEKLDAQYATSAFHIFDLFYNKVERADRLAVLHYDWCSFLNDEILKGIDSNPYLNTTQKQLWGWIVNDNYVALKFYFFKKKIRKVLKKLRSK